MLRARVIGTVGRHQVMVDAGSTHDGVADRELEGCEGTTTSEWQHLKVYGQAGCVRKKYWYGTAATAAGGWPPTLAFSGTPVANSTYTSGETIYADRDLFRTSR